MPQAWLQHTFFPLNFCWHSSSDAFHMSWYISWLCQEIIDNSAGVAFCWTLFKYPYCSWIWIDVNETIIPAPSKTLDLQPLWMIVCPGPHDWIIEIGLFHFFSSIGSCLVDMYAKCKRMERCLKVVQQDALLWCGLLNHPCMIMWHENVGREQMTLELHYNIICKRRRCHRAKVLSLCGGSWISFWVCWCSGSWRGEASSWTNHSKQLWVWYLYGKNKPCWKLWASMEERILYAFGECFKKIVLIEQCYFSSCCKFQEDLQLDQIILCMNLRPLQIDYSRDLCSMCLHGWCVIEALAHHKVNNFKDCIVVVCFIEVVLNRLDLGFSTQTITI